MIENQGEQKRSQNQYQSEQVVETVWPKMLPNKFVIPSYAVNLTNQQIKLLVGPEQEQAQGEDKPTNKSESLFKEQQAQTINKFIKQSPQKSAFVKVNNRTPKDLDPFLHRIHNSDDLATVLRTSEYILQPLQIKNENQANHGQHYDLRIREFVPEIYQHQHHYEVYVKSGVTIAIVQRFRDHIGKMPSDHELQMILGTVQTIMPGIAITMPKKKEENNQKHQPNCFIAKIYCKENYLKILGIHYFTDYQPLNINSLISRKQLEQYYSSKVEPTLNNKNSQNKEEKQQLFQINENVVPLIKFIQNKEEIKAYDMGEYKMGNEIKDKQMLEEWKSFKKEAEQKLKQ